MNKADKVSVIINCLNGKKFLDKSINSALSQDYKNLEIIFWDNNSIDGSVNYLKKFKSKKIKIFKSKRRTNLYIAKNNAISKANGRYIAFLDVDDYWEKNKISQQIQKIKSENSDLVYTNHWIKKKKSKKIFSKKKLPSGYISKEILQNYPISLSTVLMKKETCLKYGGFSSKYKIISDFDLFFKISLNCKISCINKPLATYLIHDDNTSEKYLYFRVNDMDKWINFNKYSFENKKLFKYCENIQERNNYLRIKLYITQNKKFKSFRNIFLIKSNLLKIKIIGHLIKKIFT